MKNLFKYYLQKSRNFVLGDFRSIRLSDLIVNKILKYNKSKNLRILDYGAGHQPVVVYFIVKKLTKNYKKKVQVDCYDYYSKEEMKKLNKKNKNIRFAHINSISKNKKKYDFCLINDVIHHIGIENEKLIIKILNSLMSVSKIVLIKDHFQTGKISNFIIRVMDFLGNYFNNVSIPKIYYNKKTFGLLIKKTNSKIIYSIDSIKLYPSHLLFMSNPNFNFACLLRKKK